jgi:hypothetical protein
MISLPHRLEAVPAHWFIRRSARHALTLLVFVLVAGSADGQTLLVGADGAIHLDELNEPTVSGPVIIDQSPELLPPAIGEPTAVTSAMVGTPSLMTTPHAPLPSTFTAPYGSCVPFAPYSPVITHAVAQQPLPIAFALFGEFLYLRPHCDFAHAVPLNGATLPVGAVGVNDFDYGPGFRVGGDIAVSPTNSLAASGSWFDSDASSRVTAPVGGSVASFVQIPATTALASAASTSDLSFYTAEAEYRSRLLQGPRHWVNGGLGLRYAHLEQEFSQTAILAAPPGESLSVLSDIQFDGGGPRLTLDGGRALGRRGFSIYARSSVAPLTGRFHADYSFRNVSTDTQLASVHFEDDRIMTLFDYEVGLAWSGPRKRWRLAAGYTQSYWFNALTTEAFIPAVQSGNFSNANDTLMFDGLTARVEHFW